MAFIAGIFVNAEQKRLRAGWRILIHLIGFVALIVLAGIIANLLPLGRAGAEAVNAALYFVGGLGLAWLMARFIDRRRFAAYGFHLSGGWVFDFVIGLGLGAVLVSGMFFSMRQAGWIEVTNVSATDLGVPIAAAFGVKLLTYIAVGLNEELAFRGYQLRNLAEGFSRIGPRAALVLATVASSTIFGVAHFANELGGGAHTSGIATTNLILAGLLLALPFLFTGELAMPIGIHITFNLFEGVVYGFPVSGIDDGTRLVTIADRGPEQWTGGDYGPEGGLVCTIWLVVGCVVTLAYAAWRKRGLKLQPSLATYTPR